MRLIDADALERHVYTEWVNGELSNSEWVDFRQWLKDEPTVEPASPWHRVDEPPKPFEMVIAYVDQWHIFAAYHNGHGAWKENDGFNVIGVRYWMPIEPPKEEMK